LRSEPPSEAHDLQRFTNLRKGIGKGKQLAQARF
jgi:hypothetical protein